MGISEKARDELKTDSGYYSPGSEDDPGCSASKQLAQDELEADTWSYSSVSEDNERNGLEDNTGRYSSDSEDDDNASTATDGFTWMATRASSPPRTEISEDDENNAGDEHYLASDGRIMTYK